MKNVLFLMGRAVLWLFMWMQTQPVPAQDFRQVRSKRNGITFTPIANEVLAGAPSMIDSENFVNDN